MKKARSAGDGPVLDDNRLWPGRLDAPAGPMHLWYGADGRPALDAERSFLAVASTTVSPDAADAPSGSKPRRFEDFAALLAEVPAGAGVVIDAATSARRVVTAASLAGLRSGAAPRGDEEDLLASAVPGHLVPVVEAATAASARAGVKHVAAAWVERPGGLGALLVMLSARPGTPTSVAALDEALAAVEGLAPLEPVRVVITSVLGVGRAVAFSKAGLPRRGDRGRRPDRGSRGDRAERRGRTGLIVLLAVVAALLGAVVLSLPLWAGWHGAAAVAAYVLGGLLVVAGVGAAFTKAVGRRGEAGGPPAPKS